MDEGGGRRCSTAIFCGRTGLLVLMTGYAFVGALLFKALEGGNDGDVPAHVQRSREDCLRELWLITERLNVLYEKNWTRLVTEQLKRFERAVVEAGKADGASNPAAPHWTFGGALLYSLTLLTTVGYGRLSPRTALGKVVAVIYALIGVPLMLILLSALGAMLASGARKAYSKICCQHDTNRKSPSVGYHKAPSSPSGKLYCKTHEDSASIQIASAHSTPNHVCKSSYQHVEHGEIPKRAILATVRSSHSRGRCRQSQVRQMLADTTICPTHSHGTPTKSSLIVGSTSSDIEDADEADDSEHVTCSHDTPSRVPLIWRPSRSESPPPAQPSPSVPASLVLVIFFSYVCVGAAAFASTSGWNFLDATYFCFIALSTIGIGDKLPQSGDAHSQLQLLACCLYLFLGLVVVAMCFSLVHEEISTKCKHIANNMGLLRH
ncbi:TWiK family of potassium channels protein 7 isoform X1 [Tribolium castaneum]|nr:PREDICTED: TWiK family of potassium channels protein 7 isoform X1 [Tribolium castaneum]|eukprot:XP_015837865.1 PREDICTED: TWiK family of potassium channels protein 7 isoform X1 [Tribolium castaneum]